MLVITSLTFSNPTHRVGIVAIFQWQWAARSWSLSWCDDRSDFIQHGSQTGGTTINQMNMTTLRNKSTRKEKKNSFNKPPWYTQHLPHSWVFLWPYISHASWPRPNWTKPLHRVRSWYFWLNFATALHLIPTRAVFKWFWKPICSPKVFGVVLKMSNWGKNVKLWWWRLLCLTRCCKWPSNQVLPEHTCF